MQVTIEGSLMPAAGVLKRGERATVTYTERIARLIDSGRIKIVAVHTTPQESEQNAAAVAAMQTAPESDPELPFEEGEQAPGEPSPDAGLETWQEFLDEQGISYPASASRDDLVAGWIQMSQQRVGGA